MATDFAIAPSLQVTQQRLTVLPLHLSVSPIIKQNLILIVPKYLRALFIFHLEKTSLFLSLQMVGLLLCFIFYRDLNRGNYRTERMKNNCKSHVGPPTSD